MGNTLKKEMFECNITFPKDITFKLDKINVSKDKALIYFVPPKNNLKFDRIVIMFSNTGKDHFHIENTIELNKNLTLFKFNSVEYLQKIHENEDNTIIIRMNKNQKIKHALLIIPIDNLFALR
tara:strand:- start:241 stop:609 length:369 start_codon:yes stop_codon:yes gene_type:complete